MISMLFYRRQDVDSAETLDDHQTGQSDNESKDHLKETLPPPPPKNVWEQRKAAAAAESTVPDSTPSVIVSN